MHMKSNFGSPGAVLHTYVCAEFGSNHFQAIVASSDSHYVTSRTAHAYVSVEYSVL